MKIKDAIAWADEVKPNAFTERVKFEWLNALEGKIAADVFLLAPAEVRTLHYVYPEDLETELLVGPPHNKGGTNKDLGKFADQLRALIEKWDR